MTGDTLPRSVKPVFHEFCDCCKYLALKTTEMSFTSDNHVWKEYTVSCEHYDACARAYDESLSKAKESYFDYYGHRERKNEDFKQYLKEHGMITLEEEV